jgi:CO/xanthine dehydrogenase FAD-binding subunit
VKPAPFEYESPRTIDEALALVGDESRPLAGGQSLVPMLNFRLARPARIVDLERVEGLAYIEADETLRIGAMTRQAAIEHSPVIADRCPLLRQAVRLVGHPQIRSRGTIGGSVAHADPKAELPVALAALGARFHVRSAGGERTLGAAELFHGPLMTALEPTELLVEIEVPPLPAGARTAFLEQARTHGDFAIAGVAAVVRDDGVTLGLLGAAFTPVVVGSEAEIDAPDPYRRALLAALARRAIEAAG